MTSCKKRIAVLIIITLLAPILFNLIPGVGALSAKEVSAAVQKAKLGETKLSVGVNSSPQYIWIENYNGSAEYTYISDNEKVVAVDSHGNISGKKYGKANIKITESFQGVDTEVGTVSVSVVKPYVDKNAKVGLNSFAYLDVFCSNRSATYSYQCSNTKVIKIDKFGRMQGLKLGSAFVTVTEKLKGKTTKLGKVKVKVVNSELFDNKMEIPVSGYSEGYISINYYNEKATYKFKSADTKIAKVDEYGCVTGVKVGTTKVSVTEIYNKKTIKVGTITVHVMRASLDKDSLTFDMGLGSNIYLTNAIYIKFYDSSAYYYAESQDSSIVSTSKETEYDVTYCKLAGLKLGTTKLTIFEEKNNTKTKMGEVTVTVKDYPVKSMSFYEGYPEVVDGVPTVFVDFIQGDSWYNVRDYFFTDPYNTTTPITYTSSDEKVVKVNTNGIISTIGTGSANVTATCGEFNLSMKVIVKAVPVTDLYFDGFYFDSDDSNALTKTFGLSDDYSEYTLKDYLILDPYNTTDSIIFKSSDEKVIKVDEKGYVSPVAKGKATITATCGSLKAELKVTVE
jgi:hypothetical protein